MTGLSLFARLLAMSAKKTQKKTQKKANVKQSKAPKKPEDPRRYRVFYNDPELGRRQAYPGPGVDRQHAEHLASGLRVKAELVLVEGTDVSSVPGD